MSYQLLKEDVLFYQRLLKSIGLYKKKLDGIWGAGTDAADHAFTAQSYEIAELYGQFDTRSESNIITLIPKAQVLARKFMKILVDAGYDVRIISGTRTYAEQNTLFRKGRYGNPGPRVTNARGGYSNHNFGIAWDIGLFEKRKYITTAKKYKELAQLVMPQLEELEWGGNWKSFPDVPHYQYKVAINSIAKLREAFEAGKAYV